MFPLRCPLCGKPLRLDGGSYRCENRHSYDCAKSGYVNLLDSSRKRSKIPGDNKLMSAARRDFLNKGYYEPLSDALNSVCLARLSGSSSPVILDAGCGEGYYTSRLAEAFSRKAPGRRFWGSTSPSLPPTSPQNAVKWLPLQLPASFIFLFLTAPAISSSACSPLTAGKSSSAS